MFEKSNHAEDMRHFLENEETAKQFNCDFKQVLTEAWNRSQSEAIQLMRQWGPHLPIMEIRPFLTDYFKEQ